MQTIDHEILDGVTGGANWKRIGQATVEWGGRALNYLGAAGVIADLYERWRGQPQPQPPAQPQPAAPQPQPQK